MSAPKKTARRASLAAGAAASALALGTLPTSAASPTWPERDDDLALMRRFKHIWRRWQTALDPAEQHAAWFEIIALTPAFDAAEARLESWLDTLRPAGAAA